MFKTFSELEAYILSSGLKKRIALACAHDHDALSAVVNAKRRGVVNATLIGKEDKILELLAEMGESREDYIIIPSDDERVSANLAVELVKKKEADIPMKGLMQTSTFMRAILNKEMGLVPPKGLLSQATVLEFKDQDRFVLISDCAVNIAPSYEEKVKIIQNCAKLAHAMQCPEPKVAIVSAVETVNPAIPSTIDAAMLSAAFRRGQIKGCGCVDGPFGLDNAIDLDAANHKGIHSEVAGIADILIMPDLCTGNVFTKSLTYFAKLPSAGALLGTTSPVVMTSRSDTPDNKYMSILIAILQAMH